jgi:hypothetical protein
MSVRGRALSRGRSVWRRQGLPQTRSTPDPDKGAVASIRKWLEEHGVTA